MSTKIESHIEKETEKRRRNRSLPTSESPTLLHTNLLLPLLFLLLHPNLLFPLLFLLFTFSFTLGKLAAGLWCCLSLFAVLSIDKTVNWLASCNGLSGVF